MVLFLGLNEDFLPRSLLDFLRRFMDVCQRLVVNRVPPERIDHIQLGYPPRGV